MADAPSPYSSPDVMQNILDLYADLERCREEHGPFLRELRCDETVWAYLGLLLERREPKSWMVPLLRIPLIKDPGIPAGVLRFVYDDGSTRNVQVLEGVRYEADATGLYDIPFPTFGRHDA